MTKVLKIDRKNKIIKTKPISKNKKITGTRFAAVLDLSPWKTPFATYCEITKTYEEPFTESIYTLAGQTIEPIQAKYLTDMYGLKLLSPTDVYGKDYFNKTRGDFFPDNEIFGGMWDYLEVDENNNPISVVEMKTSKRVEDWQEDIPIYYSLQAALYAYLLGLKHIFIVVSFLNPEDYQNPAEFTPSVDNTIVYEFNLYNKFKEFDSLIDRATNWWTAHITTGISPIYDEKKDLEIIKALSTEYIDDDTEEGQQEILARAEQLAKKINQVKESIKSDESQLKKINESIKNNLLKKLEEDENKTKIVLNGKEYKWTLQRKESKGIDEEALEKDGLLDKYRITKTTNALTMAILK